MATVIEAFVAKLGWQVDKKGLSTFKKQVGDLKGFAMTGARYARNFAIGFSAFFNVTALAHTRLLKLGAATHFQAETLEALDNTLSGTGLSFDTLVKASARFQAQMGDLKLGTASKEVTDALKALNIGAKELEQLSPEESFVKVTDAIIEMDDAQIAMSASTALLGQRAAQVVGHYRQTGQTVSEQIDLYRRISLVNDESRIGTERYGAALLDLKDIMTGVGRYLAGITGNVMAPYVEQLKEWLMTNKELVRTRLKEFVQEVASAVKTLVSLGSFITGIVDKLGGLGNTFKLIAIAVAAIKLAPLIMPIRKLIALAPNLGAAFAAAGAAASASWLPIAALLALLFLIGEDIHGSLTGKDSLGGRLSVGITDAMDELTKFLAELNGVDVNEFYLRLTQDGLGSALAYMFSDVTSRTEDYFKAIADIANDYFVDPMMKALLFIPDQIYLAFVKMINKLGPILNNIPGINIPKIKKNTFSNYLSGMTQPDELKRAGAYDPNAYMKQVAVSRAPSYRDAPGQPVTINQTTNVETGASSERIASATRHAMERVVDRAQRNMGR